MNLIHYWWIKHLSKEEDIVAFNRSLESGHRSDGTPNWWKGDEDAARASLAFARSMGFDVAGMTARAQAGV